MSFMDRLRGRRSPPPWAPPHGGAPSFADLSEMPDPSVLPPLDRPDVDEAPLSPDQIAWRRDGVVIKRGFLTRLQLDPYIRRRLMLEQDGIVRHMVGWHSPSPYEHVPELRELCLYPPLMRLMEELVGEKMLLHLNLTGWVSTERDWHQDDYLNPPHVNGWYAAVWLALAPIPDDCGPFEYIPGSHRWPLLRQARVKRWMPPEELARRSAAGTETWPKDSERFVVPAIEAEIAARGMASARFTADTGDLLIWHGRLLHRGTKATGSNAWRPALISHYTGVGHRPDMPERGMDANGYSYALAGHALK